MSTASETQTDILSPFIPDTRVRDELARGKDLSIINLIDYIIEKAYHSHVSDIHIDPTAKYVRVRMRIDGVLQEMEEIPKSIHSEVISRIKVLSGLRTDEHQAAQDGRFRYAFRDKSRNIDLRVSIVPTYHGENVVIRLLTDKAANHSLETLGFSERDRMKILHALKKPTGMILATGPTGSGKTTTLYTLIKMLNAPDVSIVTIEDPIEYAVEHIEQIQVNARAGLTFANGLRSILRQDPNIIMVGEIRDAETASIAVNTALTGHLLLSTLHTNDAATTLPRLLEMKIESYLVASTVNIAMAQRLVRKICIHCKEEVPISEAMKNVLGETFSTARLEGKKTLMKGRGCEKCGGSGYSGRIVLSEVIVADNDIREAILRRASSDEIKQIAIKNGMTTMFEDGIEKVLQGHTTLEEVLRVVHE
jgi:type II secretory ATPase GspE/PulE/Tfp pilus assembly ATPase PilB-like protein